jgi:hypothetical protein
MVVCKGVSQPNSSQVNANDEASEPKKSRMSSKRNALSGRFFGGTEEMLLSGK